MAVFLTVLKVLGIVLLVLLAFLLIIMLLVLFVPFRWDFYTPAQWSAAEMNRTSWSGSKPVF